MTTSEPVDGQKAEKNGPLICIKKKESFPEARIRKQLLRDLLSICTVEFRARLLERSGPNNP